eukprot:2616448-Pyramimonas_sp.AAC.1
MRLLFSGLECRPPCVWGRMAWAPQCHMMRAQPQQPRVPQRLATATATLLVCTTKPACNPRSRRVP